MANMFELEALGHDHYRTGDFAPVAEAIAETDPVTRDGYLYGRLVDARDGEGHRKPAQVTDVDLARIFIDLGTFADVKLIPGPKGPAGALVRDASGIWRKPRAGDAVLGLLGEKTRALMLLESPTLPIENTVKAIQSKKRLDAAAAFIKTWPGLYVDPADMDCDPWVIGTPAGIIDLKTGATVKAPAKGIVTKSTAVAPAATADCPRFLRFMDQVTLGDEELKGWLHRMLGYALCGERSMQIIPYIYGDGGNGKSVLLNLLQAILGDYCKSLPTGFFAESWKDDPARDVAILEGVRLGIAQETSRDATWNEGRLKALTGGERVASRKLYQEARNIDPTWALMLTSNNLLKIKGVDPAYRRRIRVVPFRMTLEEGAADTTLPAALSEEAPGVMRWLLDGLALLLQEGGGVIREPKVPAVVAKASADYFEAEDVLGQFIGENLKRLEGAKAVPVATVWAAFTAWAVQVMSAERLRAEVVFGGGRRVSLSDLRSRLKTLKGASYRRLDSGMAIDGYQLVRTAEQIHQCAFEAVDETASAEVVDLAEARKARDAEAAAIEEAFK